MTHEDWFDSDGFFIGHIPRVIWRQVANDILTYTETRECINDLHFTVDREKALDHVCMTTAWRMRDLKSWDADTLEAFIFCKICDSLAEYETFQLSSNESIKYTVKDNNMLHGWYSKKQAESSGTVRYELPNGDIATVSMVSSDPNPTHGWDDMQYIGLVERYHSGRLKERVNLEDRSNKP